MNLDLMTVGVAGFLEAVGDDIDDDFVEHQPDPHHVIDGKPVGSAELLNDLGHARNLTPLAGKHCVESTAISHSGEADERAAVRILPQM
jgi:hypothetical protein